MNMSFPDSFEQFFGSLQDFRERYKNLPVTSVTWLYCTNTRDPVHQKLLRRHPAPNLWIVLLRMGWVLLRSVQWFSVISYLRWKFRKEMKGLSAISVDGVAKTWVYPKREVDKAWDFYYGDLQKSLKERNFSLFMLCGNPVEKDWFLFASKIARQNEGNQLPDFCLISPFRVFQMALLQIGVSFRLLLASVFSVEGGSAPGGGKKGLMYLLLRQASCDSLRSQTLLNGLHFWMGKKAAALWRPKVFLTLYEGFAWEKCLWRGVRDVHPRCKIVGYQHTVILNRTLELRGTSPSQNNRLPDVVLCSGERTLKMIKPNHEKQQVKLLPFGSFRFPSEKSLLKEPKPSSRRVLVLPEGTLSEAILLFDVAMEAASQLKTYSFIFRLHPLLSVEKVKPFLEKDLETLSNVHFSQSKKIEDDFASCSALLYRASSASLYGVLSGLKPFYWKQEGEENIDPLFELEVFREEVGSIQEFSERLIDYGKEPVERTLSDWQIAAEYVQEYTIPVNERSIQSFMESIQ